MRLAGPDTHILYKTGSVILHLLLDWPRRLLYWVESGEPLKSMTLDGKSIQTVWRGTWTADTHVTLDLGSSSILWTRLPFGPRSQASLQKAQGPGVCKLPKPPAQIPATNLDNLLGDIFRGARLPAEGMETSSGSCSPVISSALVWVTRGPQPPAEPAWAECSLLCPPVCRASVWGSGDG